MSRKENDDFVATKAEKTFDDEGKTVDAKYLVITEVDFFIKVKQKIIQE